MSYKPLSAPQFIFQVDPVIDWVLRLYDLDSRQYGGLVTYLHKGDVFEIVSQERNGREVRWANFSGALGPTLIQYTHSMLSRETRCLYQALGVAPFLAFQYSQEGKVDATLERIFVYATKEQLEEARQRTK